VQRGEIYRYSPVTARPQPTLRLVVAAQSLLDAGMTVVQCLPIVEDDDPTSLLAPRIGDLGWAVATHIERTLVSRFTEHVGAASDDEMEQVDVALRASLDL
jgi:mRNA-degrading endonuclease toxin of MazEF toxin-antitoxin module